MTDDIVVGRNERLDADDLAAIAALLPQLSASASFDPARLDAMAESDDVDLFVVRSGGEIVGMATLAVFPIPTGWRGIVEDVVVDESHRGHGIARALLAAVIARAGSRGLRTLELTSRPSRTEAIRLYESLGFMRRDTNVLRLSLAG